MIGASLALCLLEIALGGQLVERGRELLRMRRFEEAERIFARAAEEQPGSAEAHYYLGVARLRSSNASGAVAPLEAAARLGPNPAVLYELASAYLALERFQDAEAPLVRARDLAPRDARIRVQLGFTYYKLVLGEQAERELEEATALEPKNALAHFYLGLALAALGKNDAAAAAFEKAIAIAPDLVDARVAMGRVLSRAGRDADAREQLERALALDPRSVGAHNELGKIALGEGDAETASRHFERAVELDPSNREASYNLTLARERRGRDVAHSISKDVSGAGSQPGFTLVDVTAESGIDFVHQNGATGRRYTVEFAGGGVIVLDFDDDGRPDLFFVNGAPLPGDTHERRGHALYRNLDGKRFRDVTDAAGLSGHGYGMGAAAADVDDDGDVDLVVTGFGGNELFRNNGDGTFTSSRLEGTGWSTSAAFFDADGDGFLDLYVAGYLDYRVETHRACVSQVRGVEAYCHPEEYEGAPDRFYWNRGDGSFVERSRDFGFAISPNGKGLGVTVSDYDDDGDPDVYVANDTTPNLLFRNDEGRFVEVGLESGVAFNSEGLPEAGMGTDFGDFDRDGRLDVVVTNFDFETNTLYRNLGEGFFLDATTTVGLGDQSLTELGFGCELVDLDNDGWLDFLVTNGHILDNINVIQSNLTHAQPGQFFWNRRGRFRNETASVSPDLARPRVGRGLASLDVDADGDLDIVLVSNGGPAELLRNDGGNRSASLSLRLVGTTSNRDGVGARISGDGLVEELRSGSSYLSGDELRLHLGLGNDVRAESLVLTWPSGRTEALPSLEPGRYVIKEGVGVLAP